MRNLPKLKIFPVRNNFENIKPKKILEPDLTFSSSRRVGIVVLGAFHVLIKMLRPDTSLIKFEFFGSKKQNKFIELYLDFVSKR